MRTRYVKGEPRCREVAEPGSEPRQSGLWACALRRSALVLQALSAWTWALSLCLQPHIVHLTKKLLPVVFMWDGD